jgi:hypothetical protein
MIQLLATKYRKTIAFGMFFLFNLFSMFSVFAGITGTRRYTVNYKRTRSAFPLPGGYHNQPAQKPQVRQQGMKEKQLYGHAINKSKGIVRRPDIGGPTQPEMCSFKPADANNMVDLFTGDFNYNIPLLDVGGYPVNIFYSGNIGLEQEASWVGLGWNINPGLISRNMRGVPDDFNGEDVLTESQNMKPNRTWGVNLGGDFELVGLKMINIGAGVGISFNNYLGLALDRTIKGGVNFSVADKVKGEKDGGDSSMLNLSVGLNFSQNVNSRNGVTYSAGVSLTASKFHKDRTSAIGIGASTSYNSRYGIKEMQLYDQMSFNKKTEELKGFIVENNLMKPVFSTNSSTNAANLFSTTISFARPSYTPAMRMPLDNEAYSGHFQLGGAIFGSYGSVEAEVYKQTSGVNPSKVVQKKPLVGYLYYENAMNNPNAVMDFARFNDQEVTARTAIISVPQYTYDVFSIQGEGTGGSIRAYRNDPGYVRDNATGSQDKNISIGVDIGIPGHFGGNFNQIKTPTTIGEWGNNNHLHNTIPFRGPAPGSWQNVYFRNPGETSVLTGNQYTRIGGADLVRFQISGKGHPSVEPVLDRFSKGGELLTPVNVVTTPGPDGRAKRTQVVSFLTANDAARIGLDKQIKSYDGQTILDNNDHTLLYTTIDRVGGYRKGHHISEIDITEGNGKRYIYGIPVYNVKQKDFTFTVTSPGTGAPETDDKVSYTENETSATSSPFIAKNGTQDGYVQVTETPAYAHSFLLSGLLSPDYVDVTGDGITDDDLGNAVKYNYACMKDGSGNPAVHKWRTPVEENLANFNPGKRSYLKDDAGLISYGERESWYLHSIESKTMIALFVLDDRADGKGVNNEHGGINPSDNTVKALKEINLYSKADLKKNGLAGAKPIKTVHFVYATANALCKNTPDNAPGGKLTLEKIYFTYNKQARTNKDQYVFSYTNAAGTGNPDYTPSATDRWGSYKPASMNPGGLLNRDYPYAIQDDAQKALLNQQAAAWSLKRILLPSGGQIEVSYESDDYAFVQNKRAADMMTVTGFGNTATAMTNKLYEVTRSGIKENNYVFARVPVPCTGATDLQKKYDLQQKYLTGMDQVAIKLAVNMPKGLEYLTSYANIDDYGVTSDPSVIWIKLKTVDGLSPLSLTAIEYLREQLPGQATPGYDVSDNSGLKQVGEALIGMLYAMVTQFKDPVAALRTQGKAQKAQLNRCFIRLNDPDGVKYGGGQRVRSVTLKDNWNPMGSAYTSSYAQLYDYATTEVFNGGIRQISSGVASYEPTIGGDENPFQTIVQVADKLPLGPASYGAVELPVLDAFFPAPVVGYSKVTVRAVPSVKPTGQQKSRSGIGSQVTEFYTAKDFPVYYANTNFDPAADRQSHSASALAFFYKYAFDSRALSQGFLVATNNMNGKLRSQSSYAENDPTLRVNYTEHFYRNTGVNGLNEQFDFVSAKNGGLVTPGNMGIDIELMTDTREFSVNSKSLEVQAQVDLFPVILPIWLPFIWPVAGNSENHYRAVTTTKVINYHAILDSVVVFDKGSQTSAKNLVYDAETGDLVISRTNNEFDLPVYNISYPAWWAYSGMGPAYRNIDATYASDFYDGRIDPSFDQSVLESGDELYITPPTGTSGCSPTSAGVIKLWVLDKNKDNTALTVQVANRDLVFLDENGKLFTGNGVSFRIVRSGKRNMLDAKAASVMLMSNPVDAVTQKLLINSNSKVINASAVEYQEKWQVDNDVIKRLAASIDPVTCAITEVVNCNGYLEQKINPYRKGLLGNFTGYRNMVFYGSRAEIDFSPKALSKKGLLKDFALYWNFDGNNNLVPDVTNIQWVWNNLVTRRNAKGLELETKNAMEIYTAAQYGYHKTLPVAITTNSRYEAMAYEGFEDNEYTEYLSNTAGYTCAKNHLDLSNLYQARLVKDDTTGFNAHTGQYMLGVESGYSASKHLDVSAGAPNTYSFAFDKDTVKHLDQIGGNVQLLQVTPSFAGQSNQSAYLENQTIFENGDMRTMSLSMANTVTSNGTGSGSSKNFYHRLRFTSNWYIDVAQYGTYQFTVEVSSTAGILPPNDYNIAQVEIRNADGLLESSKYYENNSILQRTFDLSMCPGIHYISVTFTNEFNYNAPYGTYQYQSEILSTSYTFSLTTNAAGINYKNLSKANSCIYTKPMAATADMLQPAFTMPADKKMVFSAWVHEKCTDCANTGFISNQINLVGADNPVVKPAGPVIEGWQRYEGFFTMPANTTQMDIYLVNNSDNTIYFDDIRIHPYHANMKSYVYDPVSLRLAAELDGNNYATFYEYDEEGMLIRRKVETEKGIKTVIENRSAKQKNISSLQQ